jgi:hypothetical protein
VINGVLENGAADSPPEPTYVCDNLKDIMQYSAGYIHIHETIAVACTYMQSESIILIMDNDIILKLYVATDLKRLM